MAQQLIASSEFCLFPDVLTSAKDSAHLAAFPQSTLTKLKNVGQARIREMRASGISFQVLSHVPLDTSPPLRACKIANDSLESLIRAHRDRFAALALLPMAQPQEAAAELARCVRSHKFVGAAITSADLENAMADIETLWPVFAVAEQLNVPIILQCHSNAGSSQSAASLETLDSRDVKTKTSLVAKLKAHTQTAVLVLRLYEAGLFTRVPRIKFVLGHGGEALPLMLPCLVQETFESDSTKHLQTIKDVFRTNVWVMTNQIERDAMPSLQRVLPADKIVFGVGYPLLDNQHGLDFIKGLKSDSTHCTKEFVEGVAYRNAEKLFGIRAPEPTTEMHPPSTATKEAAPPREGIDTNDIELLPIVSSKPDVQIMTETHKPPIGAVPPTRIPPPVTLRQTITDISSQSHAHQPTVRWKGKDTVPPRHDIPEAKPPSGIPKLRSVKDNPIRGEGNTNRTQEMPSWVKNAQKPKSNAGQEFESERAAKRDVA